MAAPTIHNNAKVGDIAKTVLMSGDPLRSKFIAETYLTDVTQFNTVRNMFGYTGSYKGKRLSVMGHGIGGPSIGIYSYELFNFYDVDTIIRIGTAGGLQEETEIGDVCFGMAASTNSAYINQFRLPGSFAPCCDYGLLAKAVAAAEKLGVRYHVGDILCSDVFYADMDYGLTPWVKMGTLCVDMESAVLYANAKVAKKKALCIDTISDCPFKQTETSAEERQKSFTNMMEIALEIAE